MRPIFVDLRYVIFVRIKIKKEIVVVKMRVMKHRVILLRVRLNFAKLFNETRVRTTSFTQNSIPINLSNLPLSTRVTPV